MNSPSARSPSYRNIASKNKQSPIELKEKMRKNYKDKVQNCRNMLLNKLRGTVVESDLRETLADIYKSMFNFSNDHTITDEENYIMEEIKNELVQEELEWWKAPVYSRAKICTQHFRISIHISLYTYFHDCKAHHKQRDINIRKCILQCLEEHEKSQTDDVDWSSLEQDNVICPVCQKQNLKLDFGILTCPKCQYRIQTHKSLLDIQNSLTNCLEKHGCSCNNQVQFACVPELNDNNLYLLCNVCMEMKLVI